MISKEDALALFQKMLGLEEWMESHFKELAGNVKTKEYRDIFLHLSEDETGHKKHVQKIIGILNLWKD